MRVDLQQKVTDLQFYIGMCQDAVVGVNVSVVEGMSDSENVGVVNSGVRDSDAELVRGPDIDFVELR